MTKGDEGEWYKCCRCNDAVMPGNFLNALAGSAPSGNHFSTSSEGVASTTGKRSSVARCVESLQ